MRHGAMRDWSGALAGSISLRAEVLAALAAAVVLALPAQAQQADSTAEGPALAGRVVDATTGEPVVAAHVTASDRSAGVFTARDGSFRLPLEPEEAYRLVASQLGFADEVMVVAVDELDRSLEIQIERDPVEIEGLQVFSDRYAVRRNGYPGPVRALGEETLQGSPAPTALELVVREESFRTCPRPRSDGEEWCVWRRGHLEPVQVYIDGRPTFGDGLNWLREYAPQELYLVEIYDRGATVRAFTRRGVETRREALTALASARTAP